MADPVEAEPHPGGLALGCLGSAALLLAIAAVLSSLTFSCEVDPLAEGGGPEACHGDDEGTALRCASARGEEEAVRDLLADGAEPNIQGASGDTALLWAAEEGHASIVSLLLAADADPALETDDGHRPLLRAVSSGHLEAAAELVRGGAEVNQGGSLAPSEVSERFVDALNPDLPDERGNVPPLLIAAAEGDQDMVSALLLAGADPDLAAFGAYTPVYAAAALGYAPVVMTLVNAGASTVPETPNNDLTPSEAARLTQHVEIANALDVVTFAQ